jgi:hypothetical protein
MTVLDLAVDLIELLHVLYMVWLEFRLHAAKLRGNLPNA